VSSGSSAGTATLEQQLESGGSNVRGLGVASDVSTLLRPIVSRPQGWVEILSGLAQAGGNDSGADGLLALVGGVMPTRVSGRTSACGDVGRAVR